MPSYISTNQELRQGDRLTSNNKEYTAIFQYDSNFVVYQKGGVPKWASHTYHKPGTNGLVGYRIVLQEDGNLVMYTKPGTVSSGNDGNQIWSTKTATNEDCPRMRLTMTNEGYLVLDNGGREVWSSNDGK